MMNSRIVYLVEQSLKNECTEEEKLELAEWIEASIHDKELVKVLEEKWTTFEPGNKIAPAKAKEILSSILESEDAHLAETPVRKLNWWRLSVAASIAILLGAGMFLFVFNSSETSQVKNVAQQERNVAPVDDANPGRTKAMLTLADGTKVPLDNNPDGTIAVQGNTKVLNQNGGLIYNKAVNKRGELLYNTLTTNRGEQYPLQLSDGTRIWLNSASTIRFPVMFGNNERRVQISGEAFFEVAKDKSKPFKVTLNGMEITVLGTQFNVNGYSDESNVRTTLLEGSVKITQGLEALHLSPGQHARLNSNGKFHLVNNADIEEAVSWKNGYFHFTKDNLQTVMRKLSRWYDVDVVYEDGSGKDEQSFSGDIQKSLTLTAVLRILGKSQVKYRIEGKKLILIKSDKP